jgi:hypothetical protein
MGRFFIKPSLGLAQTWMKPAGVIKKTYYSNK